MVLALRVPAALLALFVGASWDFGASSQDSADVQMLRAYLMSDAGLACARSETPTADFQTGPLSVLKGKGTLLPLLMQVADSHDWNWSGADEARSVNRATAIRAVFFTISEYERQFADKSALAYLRNSSLDGTRDKDVREAAAQYASFKARPGLDRYFSQVLTKSPDLSGVVLSAIDVCRGPKRFAELTTLATPELVAALRSFRASIVGTSREAASGAWIDGMIGDLERLRPSEATSSGGHRSAAPVAPVPSHDGKLPNLPGISNSAETSGSGGPDYRRVAGLVVVFVLVLAVGGVLLKRTGKSARA